MFGEVFMKYVDKVRTCRKCGANFMFTASEQEFFALWYLGGEPKHCPDCQKAVMERLLGSRFDAAIQGSDTKQ
jgi:hypothetical protein